MAAFAVDFPQLELVRAPSTHCLKSN